MHEFDISMDGYTVTITVTQGKYSPTIIWETKDEWLLFVENSKELWKTMTEDRRESLSLIMKSALQRLHDKMDLWLPEALDGSTGAYIDIHVKIMLTDADEEILKHSALTKMQEKEAEEDVQELLKKFKDKGKV